jgi:MFS family permease
VQNVIERESTRVEGMAGFLDRHSGRVAVATAFLAHSLIAGSWASRIPAIKHSLDLSDGQLGVALFGMAAGTLVGGRAGGVVAGRFGARTVVRAGIPVFAATLVVAALAGDLAALTATMVVFGVVAAMVDVAMNAEAVVVERAAARPLMSGFHGMWSLGLLCGALVGVLAAAAGARPALQFAIVAAVVAAGSAPLLARLPRRAARARAATAPDAWSLPLVILGLIAFGSFLSEGAAADWSAVYIRDEAGATSAVAAAGFAGFSLGMVAARFAGDRAGAAVGPVHLVGVSATVALAGLALALAVPGAATGIIGFTLLGLGLGPVIPTVVSAAGNAGLGTLEGVVSRLFTIGYFGGVSGPAIIGFASSQVGLRAALLIPLCLVAGIVLASGRLSTGAGEPRSVEAGRAGVS